MLGKVLAKHDIVERDGDQYRLTIDPASFSPEEREQLVQLCDSAIAAYLQNAERVSTIIVGPRWATSLEAFVTRS
jgi:hypothetical protein